MSVDSTTFTSADLFAAVVRCREPAHSLAPVWAAVWPESGWPQGWLCRECAVCEVCRRAAVVAAAAGSLYCAEHAGALGSGAAAAAGEVVRVSSQRYLELLRREHGGGAAADRAVPSGPVVPVAVRRRADALWRVRHLLEVVESRVLPVPASIMVGEHNGLTEVALPGPDPAAGDVWGGLRAWFDALFPPACGLLVLRCEAALEVAACGQLAGQPAHDVRVVLYVPGAGHLVAEGAEREVSWAELTALLAGWPPADGPGADTGNSGPDPCTCTYGLASVQDGGPQAEDPQCPVHGTPTALVEPVEQGVWL